MQTNQYPNAHGFQFSGLNFQQGQAPTVRQTAFRAPTASAAAVRQSAALNDIFTPQFSGKSPSVPKANPFAEINQPPPALGARVLGFIQKGAEALQTLFSEPHPEAQRPIGMAQIKGK